MAKKKSPHIVSQSRARRDALLKAKTLEPARMSAHQRKVVVRLLEEGATLAEITTRRGIVSQGSLYRARAQDPAFDDEVRAALAQGAAQAIAEAAELSRVASESNNPDEMRIAESFHRCALAYAEKAAPREYGQLLKVGGPDGGALSLNVVSYALPIVEGKFQELAKPRARELTHVEAAEELDPA